MSFESDKEPSPTVKVESVLEIASPPYFMNSRLVPRCRQAESRCAKNQRTKIANSRERGPTQASAACRCLACKATGILNPTPIHVRYRHRLHHYKRFLSVFLTVLIAPILV
jgi:hypothetical protein